MVADIIDHKVHFMRSDISLYEDSSLIDTGTVKITESCFSWEGTSLQFYIPYLQIALHAIARNTDNQTGNNVFPHPHLLIMVEGDRVWDPNSASESKPQTDENHMAVDETESGDEDASDQDNRDVDFPSTTSILRLVPSDCAHLEDMFKALADCQALNPHPEDDNSDLDSLPEDNEYEENDEDAELENHACNNGTNFDPDQFADA
ncbi:unnamed protein product [Trichobilharzia szidati]|nr:unnamed protein product [Trichobilharzia szidati]